jgi:anti-sigma regulatory factor (Ser/Thr protein kinase)
VLVSREQELSECRSAGRYRYGAAPNPGVRLADDWIATVGSDMVEIVKHVHGAYDSAPDAPGRARLLVADALDRWDVGDEDVQADVLLLTSELVTNAIRHCRRRVEIDVHLQDRRLRIEVADDSPLEPSEGYHSLLAEKGRGLQIVERLSAGWGVTPDGDGKRVWFEVVAPD